MTFNEAKKRYIRFLKEHGIFKRAAYIHENGSSGEKKKTFNEALKCIDDWSCWIQSVDSFAVWSNTKEGDEYWWGISILWEAECVLEDIINDYKDEYKKMRAINAKNDIEAYIDSIEQDEEERGCMKRAVINGLKKEAEKILVEINRI